MNRSKRRAGMLGRCTAISGDAGQALLELALVLPVFTLLILGAVEFGQLAYAAIEVSNAARAGVQYGAQSPATAGDIVGMQTAATLDGSNVSNLTAVASNFCSCSNAPATPVQNGCPTAVTTCAASGARALSYVEVQTSATVAPFINWLGSFTLTGQAVMRVE